MSYHINPVTGTPSKCKAAQGRCPFGKADDHHTTSVEARTAYEQHMATVDPNSPQERYLDLLKGHTKEYMAEVWSRTHSTSVPFRIWQEDEVAVAKALVDEVYERVKHLALGARHSKAESALYEATVNRSTGYYGRELPFNPEKALPKLAKAKRLIGEGNPYAYHQVDLLIKKLKALEGKAPVPRKGAEVSVAGKQGSFVFQRREVEQGDAARRKEWGTIADRDYAYVTDASGREHKVGMGDVKE